MMIFLILFHFLFKDERFNRDIDIQTGYRTKALLCMPIKDASGDVIGVAQVINKHSGEQRFNENDEKVSSKLNKENIPYGNFLVDLKIIMKNGFVYFTHIHCHFSLLQLNT